MEPLSSRDVPRASSGRTLVILGVLLSLLGPVLYFSQVKAGMLTVPWYLPILGTLGLLFLLISLGRRLSFWRILGILVLGLLAGGEWFFLLSFSKLPVYAGPVMTGQSFPKFSTALADGASFTQDNLRGPQNTVMVFFRGRW